MATQSCVDAVLQNGPPAGEFDFYGAAWVYLVSEWDGDEEDEFECYTRIGVSYMLPRAYSLLQGPGWSSIYDQVCP